MPQLAEDFFGLLSRVLRFIPEVLFKSKHLQPLVSFIVECCGIEDGEIARILYNFLTDLYMQYWPRHLIEEYLENEAHKDNIQITQSFELKRLLE